MNATNAVNPPKIRVALSGVFVKLEICDNSLNTNPSFAIAMEMKMCISNYSLERYTYTLQKIEDKHTINHSRHRKLEET